MVMGKEMGEDRKTPHLQGYIQFSRRLRLTQVKKIDYLGTNRTHWEIARKDAQTNIDYCTKEEGEPTSKIWYWKKGKQVTKGQRSDLQEIRRMIQAGVPEIDIANAWWEHWLRYWRSFERYRGLVCQKKGTEERDVSVYWFSGPPNCGKSKEAHRMAKAMNKPYYVICGEQMQWWDGYNGEETIIIEEYHNSVKLTWLLCLLDRYICRLPVKGLHTYACWTTVIVTTNMKAYEVHELRPDAHKTALWSRVFERGHGGEYTRWTTEENLGLPPIRPLALALGMPPVGAIDPPTGRP